jgi:hypothetical protein
MKQKSRCTKQRKHRKTRLRFLERSMRASELCLSSLATAGKLKKP